MWTPTFPARESKLYGIWTNWLTLAQLWTDEKSRDFIAAEYPWFLDTFDGYKYPIQRADSIRYFVLAHYGGTYIDLDDVGSSFPH